MRLAVIRLLVILLRALVGGEVPCLFTAGTPLSSPPRFRPLESLQLRECHHVSPLLFSLWRAGRHAGHHPSVDGAGVSSREHVTPCEALIESNGSILSALVLISRMGIIPSILLTPLARVPPGLPSSSSSLPPLASPQ